VVKINIKKVKHQIFEKEESKYVTWFHCFELKPERAYRQLTWYVSLKHKKVWSIFSLKCLLGPTKIVSFFESYFLHSLFIFVVDFLTYI
jgi:hypothetical protein